MQKVVAPARLLARLAFGAIIVTLPFRLRMVLAARPIDTIYKDYTDFLMFVPDGLMLATLALWLVTLAIERRRVIPGSLFISIPLAGLTLVALLTSFFSVDPGLSFYHTLRLLLLDAIYLFVVNEIQSLAWLTVPLSLQILIQATVGIAQFSQQHSIGLQALGEYELDPLWSGVSVVFADGVRLLRAYGLTDHPNLLGGCLTLGMLLHAARFSAVQSLAKILTMIVFVLGAVVLLVTFSRAAAVAFGLGIIFIAIVLWRTQQLKSLQKLALLCATAALFVLPLAWQNVNALGVRAQGAASATQVALEIRSVAERDALNRAANRIFNDRPILGVGISALPEAIHAYDPNFEFYAQPAHIALLDAAAETGIFGALFYFALMITPWVAVASLWRRAKINWSPALLGASAVLLGITTVGFFDYYTWLLVPGRLWQWVAWGLWSAAYQSSIKS